jgi:hypothetical protein
VGALFTLLVSAGIACDESFPKPVPEAVADNPDAAGFVCPPLGISKGPWALDLTETSVKIRWEACRTGTDPGLTVTDPSKKATSFTSTESAFVVNNTYGAPLAPLTAKDWAGTYYMHEAVLKGLSPSTCYSYVLTQDSDTGARFCTARKAGEPYRFLVIGDTNPTLGDSATKVLSHVVPMNPDFTLHGGDIQYYDSTLETWAAWFPIMKPLLRVGALQAAIGNHESEKVDEYLQYTLRFFGGAGADEGNGYYRFSSGGITFFSVNTQDPVTPTSTQGQWLLSELAAATKTPGFRASVVFFHKPFLTCGDTGDDTTAEAYWAPIFVQYKVPLVFQAHMHGYERFEKDGVTWVTAAGGGGNIEKPSANIGRAYCDTRKAVGDYYNATIVDVTATSFTGQTVDTEGAVRDTFTTAIP